MKNKKSTILALILSVGCASISANNPQAKTPKNVIFIIGDGMGPEEIKAAHVYRGNKNMAFENYPAQTMATTNNYQNKLTDSAAAATAMATGQKVSNKVVSLRIPGSEARIKTILEMAKDAGKSTGTITNTPFWHATPAGFAAHSKSRRNKDEIIKEMFEVSQPNIVFGANLKASDFEIAGKNKYCSFGTNTELKQIEKNLSSKIKACTHFFGGFGQHPFAQRFFDAKSDKALPIEHGNAAYYQEHDIPHLSDMTKTALSVLEKNDSGFLLMIESGLIDWIGHMNKRFPTKYDALEANNIELEELHRTVQVVDEFVKKHPDTLVVLTADHETGGLVLDMKNTNCLGQPKCVAQHKWTSPEYKSGDESYAKHTDVPVNVYAKGPGAELFNLKQIDNTDFVPTILEAGFLK